MRSSPLDLLRLLRLLPASLVLCCCCMRRATSARLCMRTHAHEVLTPTRQRLSSRSRSFTRVFSLSLYRLLLLPTTTTYDLRAIYDCRLMPHCTLQYDHTDARARLRALRAESRVATSMWSRPRMNRRRRISLSSLTRSSSSGFSCKNARSCAIAFSVSVCACFSKSDLEMRTLWRPGGYRRRCQEPRAKRAKDTAPRQSPWLSIKRTEPPSIHPPTHTQTHRERSVVAPRSGTRSRTSWRRTGTRA